jgi:NAD(P)-dependent dehydrogenase (short-subunit alcohol dehydrogenase family)
MKINDFAGTVVLITGGTSGIGEASALAFAERGAHVLVGGRDVDRGASIVRVIQAHGGTADFLPGNLHSAATARDFATRALAARDRVDVLINNAAIALGGSTPGMSEASIDLSLAVNVKVPFILVGELAPPMVARGKGAIVNVSSMRATASDPEMALYGATKAALNLLTKAWSEEFGPRGVRVNAVAPGATITPMTAHLPKERLDYFSQVPARRMASANEIASAIVYLASDDASFVHGAILPVDGGRTAR